jgi:multiple sugar transport system ATP-binding protein
VFARVPASLHVRIGDRCSLDYRPEDVLWFDETSGARIPSAFVPA